MKFEQALEMMRLGKLVRRPSWHGGLFLRQQEELFIYQDEKTPERIERSFSVYNILAEDWEVVELPKSLEEVLPAFREGKKIRRRSWDADSWISPLAAIGAYVAITINDMKANDWEILDD